MYDVMVVLKISQHYLVKIKRMKSGRNEHPSLMIVDAQSVKTAGKGEKRGFDGGKKNQRS